jgi:hypothetical protein
MRAPARANDGVLCDVPRCKYSLGGGVAVLGIFHRVRSLCVSRTTLTGRGAGSGARRACGTSAPTRVADCRARCFCGALPGVRVPRVAAVNDAVADTRAR